jgi:hypothetical protein
MMIRRINHQDSVVQLSRSAKDYASGALSDEGIGMVLDQQFL